MAAGADDASPPVTAQEIAARLFAPQEKTRKRHMSHVKETGWVIEHEGSQPSAPLYFCGFRGDVSQWSHNSLCAVRFSREEDAKLMLPGFPLNNSREHRIREHEWG